MTAALEGGEWSAARSGRTLPPGIDSVPIVEEAGWVPGPVWTCGISRPYRDQIPDLPARSQSLYRLSYLEPNCSMRSDGRKDKNVVLYIRFSEFCERAKITIRTKSVNRNGPFTLIPIYFRIKSTAIETHYAPYSHTLHDSTTCTLSRFIRLPLLHTL